MEKLIIASFAIVFLLGGVQTQKLGPGERCVGDKPPCDQGLTCNVGDGRCRINRGGTCDPEEDWCEKKTFCDEDCFSCRVKAGAGCDPGFFSFCLLHATCAFSNPKCKCDIGYTAQGNNTECSGGLAGTVVSLTLMTASNLLASRLF